MNIDIEQGWRTVLKDYFHSPEFVTLTEFVKAENYLS